MIGVFGCWILRADLGWKCCDRLRRCMSGVRSVTDCDKALCVCNAVKSDEGDRQHVICSRQVESACPCMMHITDYFHTAVS
jgi:hypothetical protein